MTNKRFSTLSILAALVLSLALAPPVRAVEILRWQRLPLAVPLAVGEERIVFIERNVRVGVPGHLGERLRVQSAGGAIYLRASEAIPPTRLQLQDVESGALILLDIAAELAKDGQTPLEPVRIVMEETAEQSQGKPVDKASNPPTAAAARDTPIPVVLIRYAAQNLYAPLRSIEPVAGIRRANLSRELALDTLLPALPVRARSLAAWRLSDQWVTAVRLSNVSTSRLDLDPRLLQGDFVAASFQHSDLGPAGEASDTTVAYLVTRGHGLAESLLPAIAPFNTPLNLPRPGGSNAR
ncbi:MAG: TIGR03749 family integrating conjugative element protein [Candidatus Accumulibacter sp.]|jgi:integrating conjugative element protein (TIGR03749 family)|nr:TIGR03749 family integrating conjugative element protein [Accumulibacter sp.]